MKRGTLAAAIAVVVGIAFSAGAQERNEAAGADDAIRQQMKDLLRRMEMLERQHNEDQQRIRELEKRLPDLSGPRVERGIKTSVPETDAAPSQPPAGPPLTPVAREFQTNLQNPLGALGQGNLYNPQITAFLDLGGSISTNGDNRALNRFNLREAEIDFRGAVSPWADGVLILAIGEEIDMNPDGIDISTDVEIEEGYLNFHTLPLDLSLKVGKFRNSFGRSNLLHTHDLPQISRPLVVREFLGPEGLETIGLSASWLVPNPWDKYLELIAEVVNSDGGEESPILGGPNAENPAIVMHLKLFDDVGETGSIEIGGSYLFARTSDDGSDDANVFGLDLTYQWLDPESPDFRSLLLQSELFWAENDIPAAGGGTFRNDSFGMYAFGQYQFDKNWYTGMRFDYTEFPNSESFGPGDSQWAVSPYISYYLTEFIRLRFEYQHREFEMGGGWDNEDNFLIGLTFSIGAHPTHPYWVNR